MTERTTELLNAYNELTRTVKWWDMISKLEGFDDNAETYDPKNPQVKLQAYLATVRQLQGDAYAKWKNEELFPLRMFVTRFWCAPNMRTDEENEYIFYERRFSFLKLCVLLAHYEQSNWRRFDGNENKRPGLDDCPQPIANFAADCNTYGVLRWDDIRKRHREAFLKRCAAAGPFVSATYGEQV